MTTPWWQLEWLWATTGWMLLGLGAALLWWSLFRDRSRGRRRCPKCWYDMTGVPEREENGARVVVCPECGGRALNERRLHRTRRKWVPAAAAMLVLFVGYAALHFLELREGGWVRGAPSTVLAIAAPTEHKGPGQTGLLPSGYLRVSNIAPGAVVPPMPWRQALGEEAWRRVYAGEMWKWQSQQFVSRAMEQEIAKPGDRVFVPRQWPVGESIPVLIDEYRSQWFGFMLVSRASTKSGRVESRESTLLLDGLGSTGRKEVAIELALQPGNGHDVYTLVVRRPIEMLADRISIFRCDASAATTELVREAMDVRLWLPVEGGVSVVMDDRSELDPWTRLHLGMGCVVDVRLGDERAGKGTHRPQWSQSVFKNWEELEIAWEPGMKERVRAAPERVRVIVTGDAGQSFEVYRRWPFADPDPACWTGQFEVTPRLVERPDKPFSK